MGWPTPQDYNEAMQAPWLNLNDRALKSGKPALDILGLPRPMTGAFASVYKIECDGRSYAIKLFLRKVPDQQLRYAELSRAINSKELDYTVGFQYQSEGISIRGANYPLLRMEWAEGENLDQYINEHCRSARSFLLLLDNFRKMIAKLKLHGVAHGDLQHGNILVKDGELKLVDYDGMYVPQLKGYASNEIGHPNYQHPQRNSAHFGPYLDNFSAWVIHTSLLCLSIDPGLWKQLDGGDECLLFRKKDFNDPLASKVFKTLENHSSDVIRANAKLLRYIIMYPPEHVPPLDESLTVQKLPAIKAPEVFETKHQQQQTQQPQSKVSGNQKQPSEPPNKGPAPAAGFGLPEWMQPGPGGITAPPRRQNASGSWPRYDAYKQAISDPMTCFSDLELRQGRLVPEVKGMGTHGFVFHLKCQTRHVAVKCFNNYLPDRQKRFEAIQKYTKGDARRYFMEFQYQPEGIKVGQFWYPILVMDWVTPNLNEFIQANMRQKQRLAVLADNFERMIKAFQIVGIAHGDLEPDNMLIVNNDFKLIDYDGMYVPELADCQGIERGHPAFQHPDRQQTDFGSNLDHFSAWILHAELQYLKLDPQLWSQAEIRSQVAVAKTSRNAADFSFLEVHPSKQVRHTGDVLRKLLDYDFENIPQFNAQVPIYTLG